MRTIRRLVLTLLAMVGLVLGGAAMANASETHHKPDARVRVVASADKHGPNARVRKHDARVRKHHTRQTSHQAPGSPIPGTHNCICGPEKPHHPGYVPCKPHCAGHGEPPVCRPPHHGGHHGHHGHHPGHKPPVVQPGPHPKPVVHPHARVRIVNAAPVAAGLAYTGSNTLPMIGTALALLLFGLGFKRAGRRVRA